MKSNYKRLGDYIQLVDVRNTDSSVSRLLGINISKNFMPSVANVSQTDLSKYKIIRKGQFAYSAMQTGRDETIRVVLYTDDEPAIISPAYLVFEVKDEDEVLPEFLMINFKRPESDRYGWFISDGSVRASLEWERFCEIELPIPDIEEQKKYVMIYKSLLKNQKAQEKSLADLQLICDSYMEILKHDAKREPVDKFVKLVDERNTDGKVENLLGLNIQKEFMPSKANVSQTDLTKYKILKKGLFAYSPMQAGRDETIRVALYNYEDKAIITPAYSTFKIEKTEEIYPEFFMLWFMRSESNRYGWFISDGSVRASLDWNRFCEIEIPVPSLEVQKSIVAIHHVVEKRKRMNEQLKNIIQDICPILMSGVVKNFPKITA